MVGCRLEDPWEVNDPGSRLIIQVDPNNKDEIIEGILTALTRPKGILTPGLERFYFDGFKTKFHEIITDILGSAKSGRVDGRIQ